MASDLQRQGQRKPYQTPPAVEQIPLPAKNEAFRGLPFSLVTISICSRFFTFNLISNHLYVLGFEKSGEDESVNVREVYIL